ncbi:MAG: hypothetical protein FJW92_00250 [Actinobacteria bacterium]|nr:hypothetical protein [Actinomycetota bacterium]
MGPEVLLHDLGRGIVNDPFLAHPPPAASDAPGLAESAGDLRDDLAEDSERRSRVLGSDDLADLVADEFAGWAAGMGVHRVAKRNSAKRAATLSALFRMSPEQRRAVAQLRLRPSDIVVADADLPEGRSAAAWHVTIPGEPLNVVVHPDEGDEAARRLIALVGRHD